MTYIVEYDFSTILRLSDDDGGPEMENIIVIFTRKLNAATHIGQDRILLVRTIRLNVVPEGKKSQ